LLAEEEKMGLNTEVPYRLFAQKVVQQRESLRALMYNLIADGQRIAGYGASTKGNVLLQYCGFGPNELCCIADVIPDKYGSFTPGTGIPIVSEEEAKAMEPDYFLVLPWHFRPQILTREHEFRTSSGRFIFPPPEVEIV
jgi:hypothetical protein